MCDICGKVVCPSNCPNFKAKYICPECGRACDKLFNDSKHKFKVCQDCLEDDIDEIIGNADLKTCLEFAEDYKEDFVKWMFENIDPDKKTDILFNFFLAADLDNNFTHEFFQDHYMNQTWAKEKLQGER